MLVFTALAGIGVGGAFPVLVLGVAIVEATVGTAAGGRLTASHFHAGFAVCGVAAPLTCVEAAVSPRLRHATASVVGAPPA